MQKNKLMIIVLSILLFLNVIAIGTMTVIIYINTEQIASIQNAVEVQTETMINTVDKIQNEVINMFDMQSDINLFQLELHKLLEKKLIDLKNYTEEMKSSLKSIDYADIENVRNANVLIVNYTIRCLGSGTHIRIKNQDYILTAGHLINEENDIIRAVGDYKDEYVLNLIKLDIGNDLALFRIEGGCPKLGTLEISDIVPQIGSEVTVIGNPAGDVDIITDGILCKIEPQWYKVTNKCFYGNSGGALLYKGKIIGVCSQIDMKMHFPVMVIYTRFIKLSIIQEFLREFTE